MKIRSRRVITRSGAHVRGYLNSFKNTIRIPWESPLERDALTTWEFDPSVIEIRSHQRELRIDDGVSSYSTFPDFQIKLIDGRDVIVEVKSETDLENQRVQNRLETTRRYLAGQKIEYWVYREKEIRLEPRLSSLLALLPIRRQQIKKELSSCQRTRSCLLALDAVEYEFGTIADRVNCKILATRLLANGFLASRWEIPLGDDLLVQVNWGTLQ